MQFLLHLIILNAFFFFEFAQSAISMAVLLQCFLYVSNLPAAWVYLLLFISNLAHDLFICYPSSEVERTVDPLLFTKGLDEWR